MTAWASANLLLLLVNASLTATNLLRGNLRLAWLCLIATGAATFLYLYCLFHGL